MLVTQNDVGNKHSPTIQVIPITTREKGYYPMHVVVHAGEGNLPEDSSIMAEQGRVIDRCRLRNYVGCLNDETMERVNHAIMIEHGIIPIPGKNR